MDDLIICDYCGREIVDGDDYIETKDYDIFCDEEELLDYLEETGFYSWKEKE